MVVKETDVIIKGDSALVSVLNSKDEVKCELKIDSEDVDILVGRTINAMNNGYVNVRIDGKSKGIHRIVMNALKDEQVDHINGDRSDNRKCNLRRCTRSQNFMNKCKQKNNKSGFRGVKWYPYKGVNKWLVNIQVNKKKIHIGYFDNFDDAVEARRKAEKVYHGEYSPSDDRWEIAYAGDTKGVVESADNIRDLSAE